MSSKVRRIVTGYDEFGRGTVVSDEYLEPASRGIGPGAEGCEIWSTDAMPVDNSMEAEPKQRAGYIRSNNYVGTGQGTTIRITEWAPGHTHFPHRTETMDYSILISGEIDVELDGGDVVHMKPGDVIVMRGITHCWKNVGSVPAVTAFILIDAEPIQVNGKRLHTLFPA